MQCYLDLLGAGTGRKRKDQSFPSKSLRLLKSHQALRSSMSTKHDVQSAIAFGG